MFECDVMACESVIYKSKYAYIDLSLYQKRNGLFKYTKLVKPSLKKEFNIIIIIGWKIHM